jgi:hypothetical protein
MIPEQILIHLLREHAGVTELVGEGVYPGMAPNGAPVPCVIVKRIDAQQLHRPLDIKPGSFALCRARMRVAGLYASPAAGGYVEGKTLLQHIRQACGNKRGTLAGFEGASVSPAMSSPEMPNPDNDLTIEPTDFMVTYREPL